MLEIKVTAAEMKNASDGLISSLNTAEEKISELEAIRTETSKPEKRTKIKGKKKYNI